MGTQDFPGDRMRSRITLAVVEHPLGRQLSVCRFCQMLEDCFIREATRNPRLPDHFKSPLGAFIAAVYITDELLHLMIDDIIAMRFEGVLLACTLMHMLEVIIVEAKRYKRVDEPDGVFGVRVLIARRRRV
jgi:hypothetical protein